MGPAKTKHFWRNRLPHWELDLASYFMTIRCAGSLPRSVLKQVEEIHLAMASVTPASAEFHQLQRNYFMTLEKFFEAGGGFCPFRDALCSESVAADLERLQQLGWTVRNYVIMPNHIHALFDVAAGSAEMKPVWQQWKGRTARRCNQILGRQGAFWQRDWFDRWMRDSASADRVVDYIHNNPVQAGIVSEWHDYKWVK